MKEKEISFYKHSRFFVPYPLKWYSFFVAYLSGLFACEYFLFGVLCFFLLLYLNGLKENVLNAFCVLCFCFALVYGMPAEEKIPPDFFNPREYIQVQGKVEKVQSLSDRRLRLVLDNVFVVGTNKELGAKLLLYINYEDAMDMFSFVPLPRQILTFQAKIKTIHFSQNTGINSGEQFWRDKGIYYTTSVKANKMQGVLEGKPSVFAEKREKILNSFKNILKNEKGEISQAKAVLPAILFADKFYLNTDTTNLFTRASLVHSLALSGMHLGVVVFIAYWIVTFFVCFFPALLFRLPFRMWLGFVSIPLACLYLWLGNAPVSLIRASLMLFFVWLALLLQSRYTLLDILCMAAFLFLLVEPRAWLDLSFVLSVMAVLGIALSMPFVYRVRVTFPSMRTVSFFFFSLLSMSLAIQVFLLPIQAYYFGQVSVHFWLNLLWLPVLEFIVLPLAVLALLFSLIFPPLGEFFVFLACIPVDILLDFLSFLYHSGRLYMLQIYRFNAWQMLAYYLLLLSSVYLYKKVNLKLVVCFVFSLFCFFSFPVYKIYDANQAEKEERVTLRLLDVGQGQSVLVEYPKGRILIDAGGVFGMRFDTGRDIVAKVLTYQALPQLDYALVSHFDSDHAKGFFALLETFQIDNFLYAEYQKNEPMRKSILDKVNKTQANQRQLAQGDIISLIENILWFEVLHPSKQGRFASNNTSLVLRLVHRGMGIALLCGDIELAGINALLKSGQNLQADILILPHHGSHTSFLTDFYKKVNPKKVFVSSGAYNSYNFPSAEIVKYFEEEGIPLYNTADSGEILYRITKAQ